MLRLSDTLNNGLVTLAALLSATLFITRLVYKRVSDRMKDPTLAARLSSNVLLASHVSFSIFSLYVAFTTSLEEAYGPGNAHRFWDNYCVAWYAHIPVINLICGVVSTTHGISWPKLLLVGGLCAVAAYASGWAVPSARAP